MNFENCQDLQLIGKNFLEKKNVFPIPLDKEVQAENEEVHILETETSHLKECWVDVYDKLQKKLSDRFAMKWIGKISPQKKEGETIFFQTPSPCIQELVKQNYAEAILSLWQLSDTNIKKIEFILSPEKKEISLIKSIIVPQKTQEFACGEEIEMGSVENPMASSLNPDCTFQSFVVGKPNEFAYAAAKRVAEDDKIAFNPLYLHSSPGLGKTHLMHAMAWKMKQEFPDKNVVYLSSEQFVNRFIRALRNRNVSDFQDLFRSVDVLMIDDIQFICGKKASQEEFFHTFNALISQGKQIVVSADSAPAELQGVEERLQTRLAHGLVVDIHPTSYELRLGIVQEKVKLWKVDVPQIVLEFLAQNITANVRELEGALKRIIAHSELMGGAITIETTKNVLKDILGSYEKVVTILDIQKKVADYFTVKLADLKSTRRERKIARPRQIAMYLSKTLTTASLPEIAKKFERDHTTIMHAIKTIEELIEKESSMAQDIQKLSLFLKNGLNRDE